MEHKLSYGKEVWGAKAALRTRLQWNHVFVASRGVAVGRNTLQFKSLGGLARNREAVFRTPKMREDGVRPQKMQSLHQ